MDYFVKKELIIISDPLAMRETQANAWIDEFILQNSCINKYRE